MEHKIGQLFFVRDTSEWFGKGINIHNQIQFPKHKEEWMPTHIGQIIDIKGTDLLIAEAGPKGWSSKDNWYYAPSVDKMIEEGKVKIGETTVPLFNVYEIATKYEGVPYDWFSILKIALYTIFKYEGLLWNGDSNLFCSEGTTKSLYDQSKKKIQMGYNTDHPEEKKNSEYKIPFELISPAHAYFSKFVKIVS